MAKHVRTTPDRPREECPVCGRDVAYSIATGQAPGSSVWTPQWKRYSRHKNSAGEVCDVKDQKIRRESANRRCDQCGGAMPHRMHRQRSEDGRLVCDNCKKWPSKVSGMSPGQQQEFSKRAAEAVTSILRVGSTTDWAVKRATGGPIYMLEHNGMRASIWEVTRAPAEWQWQVVDEHFVPVAGGRAEDMCWSVEQAQDAVERAMGLDLVTAKRRKVAHDSGDNAILNHCPFCGSGAITGGSDGSVECDYCHTVFTVQVQPKHPNMPQTIDGMPTPPPGMPAGQETEMSAPTDPAVDTDAQGNPDDALGDAHADPTEQAGGHDPNADQDPDGGDGGNPFAKKKKPLGGGGDVPPQFRKGSRFFTTEGETLSLDSYVARLALDNADDRLAVLASIRTANDRAS